MPYDSNLKQTYDTGTCLAAMGVSGLYQSVVRPLIVGTEVVDEVMDIGDGATLVFSGTLDHFPVGLRRLIVSYIIGGTPYTAEEDGTGVITGTYCAGTLDHDTGDWTLTFDLGFAPDNLEDITGDYLYGNPGADWRELYYRNTRASDNITEPFGATCKETMLHNTGISGGEDVFIAIREWQYPAGNAYGWDLNIGTYYNTDMAWNAWSAQHGLTTYGSTYGHWTYLPMFPIANAAMPYWIFSNRQRVVVVAKCGAQYESMYLGFGRRYGEPSSYPFPCIARAPEHGDKNYASADSWHIFIADNEMSQTGGYGLLAIAPDNSYIICGGATTYANGIRVEPRHDYVYSGAGFVLGNTPTLDRTLMAPVFMSHTGSNSVLMDLDGVKFCASNAITAEDVLNADSIDHIVFPDIKRSTYYDFMCIEQIFHTTTTTTT